MRPAVKLLLNQSLQQQVKAILRRSGGSLYLPSPATCYQDSAGSTLCAVNDPVGFLMDTGQGGLSNLGPELVTNGTFENNGAGWSLPTGNGGSVSYDGNVATVTRSTVFTGTSQAKSFVSGKTYLITGISRRISGTGVPAILVRPVNDVTTTSRLTNLQPANSVDTPFFVIYTCQNTETAYLQIGIGSATAQIVFANISVRELPGNHATQATAGFKPILRYSSKYYLNFDGIDDVLNIAGLSAYTAATVINSVLSVGQTTLTDQNISAGYALNQNNLTALMILKTTPNARDLAKLQKYMNRLAGV